MTLIDAVVLIIYFIVVLAIGIYHHRKNESEEDYYVGGRQMGSFHIGLSVVATDVGGGFSIGLGGLGFVMGLSGSWMLFTGLIGAWLSAVILIPKIFQSARDQNLLTFPQLLGTHYDKRVAFAAGIISAIGYIGFTSSQLLAGAKLATATFPEIDTKIALIVMGVIAVAYTGLGGLKAVIYTDSFQWAILMFGLVFIGIPLGFIGIGGMDGINAALPDKFFSLQNISIAKIINWSITIIPIWFIGMTLYQRIYACKDEKTAKRAWYIAGLFEYPLMSFMGVLLGMFSRVATIQGMFADAGFADVNSIDAELGLPLLLKYVLPAGVMGLMLAAYFSAVMSTADSCLMAASGNILTDIFKFKGKSGRGKMVVPQIVTIIVGVFAILLASSMQNVLELMLYSYAFMVSGLLIPVLGILYFKRKDPGAAFWSMVTGGTLTITLTLIKKDLPYGLDPIFFGIIAALLVFILVNRIKTPKPAYLYK